jgi:2-isopropylmalate synthase
VAQDHVRIFDTTLRDGEQAPGFSLRPSEKLTLARQLDRLGVDIIEAGFPIASPADAEAVRQIATEVRRPVIACLARCVRADLEKAAWSIKPAAHGRIHTFIATSDLHLKVKLRITREQCLEAAVDAVRYARHHTFDVQFSAEDATRSDLDFLCQVIDAVIKVGATTINLPDTVGFNTPEETLDFFRTIRERVTAPDGVVFSAHCHDDLGLAVANSLAAIQGGARQVECTVNGIGERAGNAAMEEIVMAIKVREQRYPYTTNIDTRQIYPSSEMLTELTGQKVQVNKAIVGRNAFAHEAGIHQDGILKDRRTYEIMRAEDVGVTWNPLVLGKHSGRHAIQRRCAELGFQFEGDALVQVYRALMAIADDRKAISDDDIRAVITTMREVPVPHPQEAGYGHGV